CTHRHSSPDSHFQTPLFPNVAMVTRSQERPMVAAVTALRPSHHGYHSDLHRDLVAMVTTPTCSEAKLSLLKRSWSGTRLNMCSVYVCVCWCMECYCSVCECVCVCVLC